MIKMIMAVWVLAVVLYVLTLAFYDSPNKKAIMKRVSIAFIFFSISILILTLLTILL